MEIWYLLWKEYKKLVDAVLEWGLLVCLGCYYHSFFVGKEGVLGVLINLKLEGEEVGCMCVSEWYARWDVDKRSATESASGTRRSSDRGHSKLLHASGVCRLLLVTTRLWRRCQCAVSVIDTNTELCQYKLTGLVTGNTITYHMAVRVHTRYSTTKLWIFT